MLQPVECQQRSTVFLPAGLNIDLNPTTIVAWEFVSCAPLIQGGLVQDLYLAL